MCANYTDLPLELRLDILETNRKSAFKEHLSRCHQTLKNVYSDRFNTLFGDGKRIEMDYLDPLGVITYHFCYMKYTFMWFSGKYTIILSRNVECSTSNGSFTLRTFEYVHQRDKNSGQVIHSKNKE